MREPYRRTRALARAPRKDMRGAISIGVLSLLIVALWALPAVAGAESSADGATDGTTDVEASDGCGDAPAPWVPGTILIDETASGLQRSIPIEGPPGSVDCVVT